MQNQILALGDFADIFNGMAIQSSDSHEAGAEGNVLSVRNLTETEIDLHQLMAYNASERSVEKYRARQDDLLISSRSTTLKSGVVSPEAEGLIINSTLIGVRCLPVLHPRLLAAWLRSNEGTAAIESVSQSGTIQMNITVSGLRQIEIPVPPVKDQQKMVDLLEAADEAYQTSIQAAGERREIAREAVITQLAGKVRL